MLQVIIKLLAIFIFIAPAYAIDPAESSDENGHGDKQKIYHISDDVQLKPEVKIIYDKPRIVVKAIYPYIYSDTADPNIDNFNQQISSLIQEEVANFRGKVIDNQAAQVNFPRAKVKNDLTLDFNTSVINTDGNPIVGIRFSIRGSITGVAHSYHSHRVINYDLYNGQVLQLVDSFKPNSEYLNIISEYVNNVLNRRLKEKELNSAGTAAQEENFKNWNLNPYGLFITFDEGQVAPSVYGTETVLVPYSALKTVLAPQSQAADCMRHHRRCMQNNLLTGGFIDEAANSIDAAHRVLNPILGKG